MGATQLVRPRLGRHGQGVPDQGQPAEAALSAARRSRGATVGLLWSAGCAAKPPASRSYRRCGRRLCRRLPRLASVRCGAVRYDTIRYGAGGARPAWRAAAAHRRGTRLPLNNAPARPRRRDPSQRRSPSCEQPLTPSS